MRRTAVPSRALSRQVDGFVARLEPGAVERGLDVVPVSAALHRHAVVVLDRDQLSQQLVLQVGLAHHAQLVEVGGPQRELVIETRRPRERLAGRLLIGGRQQIFVLVLVRHPDPSDFVQLLG